MLQDGRAVVEVRGPVDAHPVLFVGGWGLSADRYRASLGELSDTFRVFIVGLPGFGDVPGLPLRMSTVEGMTSAVLGVWLELGVGSVDRPITLMGHSTGGAVAALLADEQPELVSEVVMVLPAGSPDPFKKSWPRIVEHVRRYPIGSGNAGLAVSLSPALVGNARLAVSAKNYDVVPTLESLVDRDVPVHLVVALDDLVTPPGTLLHVHGTTVHHVYGGHGWFNRETVSAASLLMGILAAHVPAPDTDASAASQSLWGRLVSWVRTLR